MILGVLLFLGVLGGKVFQFPPNSIQYRKPVDGRWRLALC